MKTKKYSKTTNLMLVTLLMMGFLSPFVFLTKTTDAKAIEGVKLVAYDNTIPMDEDGDGYIRSDGTDNIRMEWNHYYDESETHIKIKSNKLVIPYEKTLYKNSKGPEAMTWVKGVVPEYFGESNTIEIWYGERSTGYSTLTFNLPKSVSNFPIDFTVEDSVEKTFTNSNFFQNVLFRFPLFNKLLNLLL